MERLIERTLIAARWLLAPLYLGLALLLVLFIMQFFQDLWHAALGVIEAPRAQLIIEALGMVDLALVASLIVMVMLSSYANYLSRLDIQSVSAQLGWLAKLDAGSVKVKVDLRHQPAAGLPGDRGYRGRKAALARDRAPDFRDLGAGARLARPAHRQVARALRRR